MIHKSLLLEAYSRNYVKTCADKVSHLFYLITFLVIASERTEYKTEESRTYVEEVGRDLPAYKSLYIDFNIK
jgi:hypothetical protein